MNEDYIDLNTLTMEQLDGVVNLYPWFGAARQERCIRLARMGGKDLGTAQFADAAMYIGNRAAIMDLVRPEGNQDYSDKDVETLLKSYIEVEKKEEQPQTVEEPARPVRVVGGDYFTQSQYDNIRNSGDNVFANFAAKIKSEASEKEANVPMPDDYFCTETLASIYAEQGYYDEAKRIYSKLILAYPEKNAYFASQIEKLEKNNII